MVGPGLGIGGVEGDQEEEEDEEDGDQTFGCEGLGHLDFWSGA